ncbi:MAG: flavin-dependent monooxygenase [Alphaproteobacteria bacterium]|nr:flavin-dependent monooxygenase [Alphaproteobacteria bacterium]
MADLLAAARGFQNELRTRAAEIESGRQLPADIARRFAEAGFYRACVPDTYGGLEVDALALSTLIETLAQADGSAAWCVMIGATTGLLGAYMPPATARDLFADHNLILAGVYAPRGKAVEEGDHYLVNGRWQWGSGSPNATFIAGGCMVMRDGKPQTTPSGVPISRMMLVPVKDAELAGNWDVSGLCGTGSQDFAFKNLRVPKAMGVDLITDKPLPRPLYAFPAFGILAMGISSVMLGLARASIDALIALAGGKTPEGHRKPLAARAKTQEDVAEADALVRSARAYFRESIAAAWDEAQRGGKLSVDARRNLRLAATHAARASVSAVDLMYNLGGGTSVYKTSPLQRIFRDVHVASQHMMVAPPTMELAGKLLLGQEAEISQL